MSNNESPASTPDPGRDIHRQTLKSIGWKLIIVAVALVAYAGQKYLEQTKQAYDKERSRPLVIVDDADPKLANAQPKLADAQPTPRSEEDFIPLPVSSIQKPLKDAGGQPDGAQQSKHTPLAEFVNRIKYQSLKDEQEIINRLNAEVLVENDLTKRAYLDTRDALNKNRAAKLTTLVDERTQVYNRLKQVVSETPTATGARLKPDEVPTAIKELRDANPRDDKQVAELKRTGGGKAVAPARKNRRDAPQPSVAALSLEKVFSTATKEQLAVWLNTLDKQIGDEENVEVARQWIADADRVAQSQIKTIYEKLRPELSGIVSAAKTPQGKTRLSGRVLAFFDPRSIFNDKSGSYVIYQTLWLICIGVMVFFVVFLFFALLSPLPFFTGRADTLAAQFGGLLKGPGGGGEGAAPQIARSLVVSAAALGVGTAAAVAVAGDRAINRPQQGRDNNAIIASAYEPGDAGLYPPGTRPPITPPYLPLKVELTPQIVYPQPTVIEHTTHSETGAPFDPTLITGLQDRVFDLNNSNTALIHRVAELRTQVQKVDEVEKGVAGLTRQVGDVQVPMLEKKVLSVEQSAASNGSNIAVLEERMGRVETEFAAGLKTITTDLGVTKQAVSDLRDNSFERAQNSGGRNFFTRAHQQLFRGESFMVTHQSYRALEDLMCRGGCGADKDKIAIIAVLKGLTGQPPLSKSKFMEKFASVSADGLKQWRPLILKYARVSY